ncbi:MAG: DUF2160 family membrane protein [Caldilineaceae bacterium]
MADATDSQLSTVQAPVTHKGRKGFLPIETNTFDRYFISVVIFIAISLLWFRFLEPEPLGLSIWIGVAISAVIGFFIVTRG